MAGIWKQIFTWWNGDTINTRFFTWLHGKRVGEDEFGNIYYEGTRHKDGYTRRWVIYKGYSEPSTIPAGWHGWIHHRTNILPSEQDYHPREWEKPHLPNLTGTNKAYTPKGSIAHHGKRPHVTGDYDAWTPDK
ncbi:NADH:ubiquinone oxidoreductase subunit NDUFA12 [uncultured Bartonella sp.]|uniref:NADH:ubiquinone oxidoreductase subunit NDUFA12 n=1 Tax=uncultured Bartonella sp. TaxID=104108 RepID=UPI0026333E34|nr:NADH:ubiquinone oxidoreductase subunit NDUFA12 [uncultured Bartonella sp.]